MTEFAKSQQALKDKEIELPALKVKVEELAPKVQTYEVQVSDLSTRCTALEGEKEELTDQLCSTFKQGFQLALDQVKILCPTVDVSEADITKKVVDG